MAQTTTTMIFLLATFLLSTVSGQGPPAHSPTIDGAMNCATGLVACLPAIAQGQAPSSECCTAIDTAVKTQRPCLCGLLKDPTLMVPFNVTAFNALISHTCKLTTDPNMCSETAGQAPSPHTIAPAPGPPKAHKNASNKLHGTRSFVGIVLITIAAMF